MSSLILWFLGCVVTVPAENSQKADADNLQGSWVVVSVEREGKPVTDPKDGKRYLFLKGDQIVFTKQQPASRETVDVLVKRKRGDLDGGFVFDASTKPRSMEFRLQPAGELWRRVPTYKVIYELEENRLKICVSDQHGGERPTAFTTRKGTDRVLLLHLTRGKP